MKINEKGFLHKFFLILTISNIAIYALYHISYLMDYNWFEYVRTYIAEIWEFLFIPLSVLVMLEVRSLNLKTDVVKIAALCSVARIFYTIPFYYMEFMRESYPPNSFDSIILSMAFTLLEVILTFAHLYLIYGVAIFVCRLLGKGKEDFLESAFYQKVTYDFSSPCSLICLSICLSQFAIKLIGVIIDTVTFLIEYGGGYTLSEILMIILDYIFCIGLLPLCYTLICRIKNDFIKREQ